MKKTLISGHQFAIMMSGFIFGSAPLFIAPATAAYSGQDAWLSVILATILGLFVVWMNSYLGGLYPDKTIVGVTLLLFGKWLGGAAVVSFIFSALLAATQVVWYVGDFFTTMYMTEMPMYPINLLFIAALAVGLLYGLESTIRAIEIFFIIGFPLYLVALLLLIPEIKMENLQPILENGFGPVTKGVIPVMAFSILPLIGLNMVFPKQVNRLTEGKKSMFAGYFLGMVVVFLSILICILVLGGTVTANLRFAVFTVTKEIKVGTVLSRLEAVVVLVWMITNFISAYFYSYAGLEGFSELLQLKDSKRIVLPFSLIMVAYSGTIYKNVPYEIRWDSFVWPCVAFAFGFVLPAILLITAAIRERIWGRKKGKAGNGMEERGRRERVYTRRRGRADS